MQDEIMNQTIKMLKTIGSPFVEPEKEIVGKEELLELYNYAEKNKISLFFLDSYRENGNLWHLESVYEKRYERYLKINEVMSETSRLLTNAAIEHAIFKTIRPYIAETSDIDVLILGNNEEYLKALRIFKATHKLLGYGPESITFYSSKGDIGIDVYRNIAVSHVIYLDKEKLAELTIEKDLPDGQPVMTLTPEADLLAVINHSIIKEQMFTLAEYYTFLHRLSAMNEINKFLNLIEETDSTNAAQSFLTLTLILHQAAHEKTPSNLQRMLKDNPEKSLEARRVCKNHFEMPHKYSPLTVLADISEKLKDDKTKSSIAIQLYDMFKPSFAGKVIQRIIEHWMRETY